MGVGYTHYIKTDIKQSLPITMLSFPYKDGYFFDKSEQGNNNNIRQCTATDPLYCSKDVFSSLTEDAFTQSDYSQGTIIAILPDGTAITWRASSSSDGSPAVDINPSSEAIKMGVKRQKIHFIPSGGE